MDEPVEVYDPDGLLGELDEDTVWVVRRRGGYVMGGSYVNPYNEVRKVQRSVYEEMTDNQEET